MSIKSIFVTGVLLISLSSCGSVGDIRDIDDMAAFGSELNAIRQRLHVPGMAAAIVSEGEIIWSVGMGYSDIDQGVAVTPDTPFRLASVTKTIASTVIMILVEKGDLNLDRRMSEFGVTFENSPDVTVRHVLSHTSGGRNPGERYKYDGYRFSTLENVINAITGMSFSEAVETTIINRLGVNNLAASITELSNKLALPYEWNRKTGYISGTYPKHISPAAGMMGSVNDLSQFDISISSGTFMEPRTQENAWTPKVNAQGKELPYGLGWFIETSRGEKLVWHYGFWECVSSLYIKVPQRNLTFIALANSDGLSDGFNLVSGRLRTSPVGRLFLDSFVY